MPKTDEKTTSFILTDSFRKQANVLEAACMPIINLGDSATNEQKEFVEKVRAYRQLILTFNMDVRNCPATLDEDFRRLNKEVTDGLENMYNHAVSNEHRKAVNEASQFMKQNQAVNSDFAAGAEMMVDMVNKYHNGAYNQAEIDRHFDKFGLFGEKPTIDECETLSFENSDPDKVFSAMLWLKSREFMALMGIEDYKNAAPGFYQKTLDRLENDLSRQPLTVQMAFLEKMTLQDMAAKSKLNEAYEDLEINAPEDAAEKKKYFATELASKDACYSALTIHEMKSNFMTGGMGAMTDLYRWSNTAFNDDEDPLHKKDLYTHNPVNLKLTEIIIDDFNHERTAETIKEQNAVLAEKVKKDGVLNDSFASEFGYLYDRLLSDNRDAKQGFTDMKEAIVKLAKLDETDVLHYNEYKEALRQAEEKVRDYYETHKGFKFTTKGEERLDLAEKFAELIKEKREQLVFNEKEAVFEHGIRKTEDFRMQANRDNDNRTVQTALDILVETRDAMTNIVGRKTINPDRVRVMMAACIVCESLAEADNPPHVTSEQINNQILALSNNPRFIEQTRNIDSDSINEFLAGEGQDRITQALAAQRQNARPDAPVHQNNGPQQNMIP